MAFDPAIPRSVIERFPDFKETITRLFRGNENFQALCEDHQRCVDALRYWGRSEKDVAEARRDEYASILLDLETEISQRLNKIGFLH